MNQLDYIDEAFFELVLLDAEAPIRKCEYCSHEGKDVIDVCSRTYYTSSSSTEDPNRDLVLCLSCARMYDDYMTERWQEYYSMVL